MRTTIDVERPLADAAAKVLGTKALKDTVNAALREVLTAAQRRKLSNRVRSKTLVAPTPAELQRLREPHIAPGGLRPQRAAP